MAFGDVLTRLAVSLSLETAAFERGATLAEKRFAQSRKRFEAIGKKMTKIGVGMSAALTAPLVALGVASVNAAIESQDALAQVESALKSMGDAAGRTTEQLQALAESQMRQSLYDDDEILRRVTANLLTFGKIAGEQFDRAQQAAIDLSARLGQDLQSSAVMIGKALNDPIKGVTALQRVGVSFTASQKEQIVAMTEAGDVMGAQSLILAELEKQYGGAAKAAREADPMAATRMSWNEFQETVGEKILPLLPVLADAIISVLDAFNELSPGMQKAVVIGGAIVAALGPVLTLFGGLVTIGAPLLSFLVAVAPAFAALGKALLLVAANPAVLALAAVVLGIYLAWKNWDKIAPILQRLWEAAKEYIGGALTLVLQAILNPIAAVKRAFFDLYDAVVGNSYIPDMVDGIAAEIARLDAVMVKPVTAATTAAQQAFQAMAAEVRGIMARLFPDIADQIEYQRERALLAAAGGSEAALRALANERDIARRGSRPDIDFGAGPLTDGMADVGDAIERLTERAEVGAVRIAKSFKDMADETLNSLSRLTSAIKSGGFLGILEAVIGFGLQLGSIGLFGKSIAGRLNSVPGYAGGTNFHPGGLAVVGERGPELVSMPRGSRVTPNNKMGGVQRVEIVDTTGLFRFAVNGQIMEAAPGIMGGGAAVARAQDARSKKWALG